jgi:hypothetical protein
LIKGTDLTKVVFQVFPEEAARVMDIALLMSMASGGALRRVARMLLLAFA